MLRNKEYFNNKFKIEIFYSKQIFIHFNFRINYFNYYLLNKRLNNKTKI